MILDLFKQKLYETQNENGIFAVHIGGNGLEEHITCDAAGINIMENYIMISEGSFECNIDYTDYNMNYEEDENSFVFINKNGLNIYFDII